MQAEKIEDDLTYKITGCAMKVQGILGNGFQEVIYQRALAIELKKAKLLFSRELEMQISYEGEEIGSRRGRTYNPLNSLTPEPDVRPLKMTKPSALPELQFQQENRLNSN